MEVKPAGCDPLLTRLDAMLAISVLTDEQKDAQLGRELTTILAAQARGQSEGAVDVLRRILRERDEAVRKFQELDPEIVKRVSIEMRKERPS